MSAAVILAVGTAHVTFEYLSIIIWTCSLPFIVLDGGPKISTATNSKRIVAESVLGGAYTHACCRFWHNCGSFSQICTHCYPYLASNNTFAWCHRNVADQGDREKEEDLTR